MKNSSIRRNDLFGASRSSDDHSPAREPRRGTRSRRHYPVLLGVAAVTAFLLALPSAAFACVNTCSPGGVPVQFNDGVFCSGGANDGQMVCTGVQPVAMSPMSNEDRLQKKMQQARQIWDQWQQENDDEDNDPFRFRDFIGNGQDGKSIPGMGYSFRLGMTVSPASGFGDAALSGGGYSLRNGGASITDSAGLIASGTSASYSTNAGSGSISGVYDASRLVGANQSLFFLGAFDYTSSNTNYGGVGAGTSINGDNYRFKASATYTNYNTYLRLTGGYQFGSDTETTGAATGAYDTDGYHVDAAVGHVFLFVNTIGPAAQAASAQMALKAPAQKPVDGYAIGFDLSGHLGYSNDVARGFADSSGFVYGNETAHGGETGLTAKLFAQIQSYGVTWKPYVSGSVTWQYDYSHVANFPGQLVLATGDVVTFDDATTFVGAKVGLDVTARNGWTVGVNGFYDRSSDTEIIGGRAYVKIPLGPTLVTARY
jgi:hypothetical protein